MKNSMRIVACCLATMLLCSMAGCQLALKDKGTAAREDRLVGVLVTTEDISMTDMDGDPADQESEPIDNLKVNKNGEITLDDIAWQDHRRLYATLTKKTQADEETGETTTGEEYVFEGVKGISFFCPLVPGTAGHDGYTETVQDDAISDGKSGLSYSGLNENYSISLEGTIFVLPSSTQRWYYLDPVYQTADSRVYATGNMGCALEAYDTTTQSTMASKDGDASGQTLNATYTTTEDGKATSYSTSVKINFKVVNPPISISILQMDANNAVLACMQYTPGKLPKSITPGQGTEYIVVESHKTDLSGKAQVIRALYGKDAATLDTYYCRSDGIILKQSTPINWPK